MFAAHNSLFAGTKAKIPATFKGANGSNLSYVTIPTHSVGDLIIIWCCTAGSYNYASPTIPSAGGTVPTWTKISTNTTDSVLCYAYATATNTTSGTFTQSNVGIKATMAVVLTGTPGIAGFSSGRGPTTSCPTVSMADSSGASQILHFLGSGSGITYTNQNPSGYTSRVFSASPGYAISTKNTTTSAPAVQLATSDDYWASATIEIQSL